MEPWTGAQRAFAVKAFYKNGDSFVIAQREFRREFGIHRNRAVPSGHAIRIWVRNFEATGSTLKKKGGSVKTVRTSENIAVVREAIERIHTVLRVATLCHSGCLKPAFKQHRTSSLEVLNPGLDDMGWWNSTIAMNPRLSSEILAERSQNCHRFCKTLSQQNHIVLQSTAALQLERFKVGSKMKIALSTPVLQNQKKQCCKIARFTDAPCTICGKRSHI